MYHNFRKKIISLKTVRVRSHTQNYLKFFFIALSHKKGTFVYRTNVPFFRVFALGK